MFQKYSNESRSRTMIISYNDTHSYVKYGSKKNSLYVRILNSLEAIENAYVAKCNIEEFEEDINNYFNRGELTWDEYVDVLSILERFAIDEQLSKTDRNDLNNPKLLSNKKVKKRGLETKDIERDI